MARSPERFLPLTTIAFLAGMAGQALGETKDPDWHEVAEVRLKSGEVLRAGKVQEEDDTLFLVLLDYSPRAVPRDSLAGYAIRSRTEKEMPPYDARFAELEDAAKAKAADTAIPWILLAALAPVVLLVWLGAAAAGAL